MYLSTLSILTCLITTIYCQSNFSSITSASSSSFTTFVSPLPSSVFQGNSSSNATSTFSSSPTPEPQPDGSPPIPNSTFLLQTQVIDKGLDAGSNKDGLYVWSYHTGAGQGAATLTARIGDAWQGFLNGTDVWFTYPVGEVNEIGAWELGIRDGPYQYWKEVDISIAGAGGYTGYPFFIDDAGLLLGVPGDFANWYVCDWWYGAPQLFIAHGDSFSPPEYGPPASCSEVYLLTVPLDLGDPETPLGEGQ